MRSSHTFIKLLSTSFSSHHQNKHEKQHPKFVRCQNYENGNKCESKDETSELIAQNRLNFEQIHCYLILLSRPTFLWQPRHSQIPPALWTSWMQLKKKTTLQSSDVCHLLHINVPRRTFDISRNENKYLWKELMPHSFVPKRADEWKQKIRVNTTRVLHLLTSNPHRYCSHHFRNPIHNPCKSYWAPEALAKSCVSLPSIIQCKSR